MHIRNKYNDPILTQMVGGGPSSSTLVKKMITDMNFRHTDKKCNIVIKKNFDKNSSP